MSEWWRGAIIYQIYPRSFQDSTGNGIGDLKGITRRLDHVASLGVDAIWLSPIFCSPQKDMGYDVSDFTDIDPLFGTIEDFDDLIARAHELGLKVIVDQVLSHSSDQHEWFKESRASRKGDKSDWYVWAEPKRDGSPPNNWLSNFGGPSWEWEPRRRQFYQHNFLKEQPDLNGNNPAVQDALLEVMRFWLERGVDGFRLDTVNYYVHDDKLRDNPSALKKGDPIPADLYSMQEHIYNKNRPDNVDFLKRMRALTDEYDDRMMVGEVGDGGARAIEIMGDYTRGTDRLHMCYSFELLGPTFTARHFRDAISNFQNGAPDGWPKWSFTNHDMPRHVTRWAEHGVDTDTLAKQTIALLMSFEGTIGIYQGEELGLEDTELEYEELTDPRGLRFWPEDKGRDGSRTPMVWEADAKNAGFSKGEPWLPVKAPQAERALDAQEPKNDSVLHAYRETIAFRKASPALMRGKTEFIDLPEPVLAFHRLCDGQQMTCVFNLSTTPVALALSREAYPIGPQNADVDETSLRLGGNGFVFLDREVGLKKA